jgi:hypothetical protein
MNIIREVLILAMFILLPATPVSSENMIHDNSVVAESVMIDTNSNCNYYIIEGK